MVPPRAWARFQTGSPRPGVDRGQVTAAPGWEKKSGLDSGPANKRVAIYIPFHDSAGLYERIHCVTSWRLEDLKEETTEETGETMRSLDSRCKSSCSGLLLLCCGRKRIFHLKNNPRGKVHLCVHNANSTEAEQDQVTLRGSQRKAGCQDRLSKG